MAYQYELHMHSREASLCGKGSIHDMIRRYADLGYTGAVITDHFFRGNTCIDRDLPWEAFVDGYSRGYYEGQETAQKLGFHLLFGVEEGYGGSKEFLAYGFEPEFLKENPQLRNAGIHAWSEAVHAVDGVLIYAHPFRMRDYISDPNAMPDMTLADGVELYNRGNPVEQDQKAVDTFAGEDWIFIAGGDTHNDLFTERFGVELPCEVSTSAELAAALKRKEHTLLHKR